MAQLLPPDMVFVEERFIRDLFCSRLSTICSTRAAIPHVEVAQDFQGFVAQFLSNNAQAYKDTQQVFKLLNDDGKGINNAKNTAVGYRLAYAADLFLKIRQLPADMLDIPESAPVDMPARFTPRFVDAQIKLDKKPVETGNYVQDMVKKLRHIELVLSAITDFITYPLESNSRTIYSAKTKRKYDDLSKELLKVLAEATQQAIRAAKIVEQYAGAEDAAVLRGVNKEVNEAKQALADMWQRVTERKQPWWENMPEDLPEGWEYVGERKTPGIWALELKEMQDRIRRRKAGEEIPREQ